MIPHLNLKDAVLYIAQESTRRTPHVHYRMRHRGNTLILTPYVRIENGKEVRMTTIRVTDKRIECEDEELRRGLERSVEDLYTQTLFKLSGIPESTMEVDQADEYEF